MAPAIVSKEKHRKSKGPASAPRAVGMARLLAQSFRRYEKFQAIATAAYSKGPPNIDAVHDLRTGSRRLSEMVRALESVGPAAVVDALTETLRRVRRAAGAARDADVFLQYLDKWPPPGNAQPLAELLRRQLQKRRNTRAGKLQKLLAKKTVRQDIGRFAGLLERTTAADAGTDVSAQLLINLRRRADDKRHALAKRLAKAGVKGSSAKLHEARIAAKKLRYTLELLADKNGPTTTAKDINDLASAQDDLGTAHDLDVLCKTIAETLGGSGLRKSSSIKTAWKTWEKTLREKRAAHAERGLSRLKRFAEK